MLNRMLGLLALSLGLSALTLSLSTARADDAKKKEEPVAPATVPAEAKSGNADVDDLNEVTLKLWAASQEQAGEGNLAWLPTVTARSVLVLGTASSGSAKKEFDTTFPFLAKKREKEYGGLLMAAGNDKLVLKTTSALWAKAGVKVRPTLIKAIDTNLGVKTFITPKDEPAVKINAWIASVTDGKVKDGVSADTFKSDPPFVLTNAATIKGSWATGFKSARNVEGEFTLADAKTKVKVNFMQQQLSVVTFDVTDGTALAMPLDGGAFALYILPKDGKTLDDVIKGLTAIAIRDAADKAATGAKKETAIAIPKFRCESTLDLKKTATALGIKKAFDASASPSDLSFEELTPSDIFVAAWTQKTTHSWDEGGFEGTAIETVVTGTRSVGPAAEVTFKADRPFVFVVLEKGLIIDLVRVNNPKK